MVNLMSYASVKVGRISGRYAKSYAWYSLRTRRATPVGSSPPERKPLRVRAPKSYHHRTMGPQDIRRLTVLAVAPCRYPRSTARIRSLCNVQPLALANGAFTGLTHNPEL